MKEWGDEGDEGVWGVWGERGERELMLPHPPTLSMPNDGSCSTWGDPKTALPSQCPMPHAPFRCIAPWRSHFICYKAQRNLC